MKRKACLIMVFLIMFSSLYNRATIVYAETFQFTSVVTIPEVLTEDNIKWAEITMTIANDVFKNPLNPADINLNNRPAGVSIESLTRINDTTVLMKLEYNFDDFDVDDLDTHVDSASGATVGGATYGNWYLPITAVVEPANSLKALTGNSLSETNLNGAVVELVLSSHDFEGTILPTQFVLNNAPAGLTVASVVKGSQNRHVTLTLAFDGTDFDSDIENCSITVLDAAHKGNYNVTSNLLPIAAVGEPAVSMTAATIPNELHENSMDGSVVNLTLNSDAFKSSLGTGDIKLNNVPVGLTVSNVVLKSTSEAHVTLAFNGTDFDSNYPSFTIGVLSTGLQRAPSANSNTLTIYCLKEIAGLANYIATGEAYPTSIEMTGFNAKTNELHLNTRLHTDFNVTGKTAIFYYFITVHNGGGAELGTYGDITSTNSVSAPPGSQDVEMKNLIVTLAQDLPASYRIVVSIESVVVT